MIVRLHTMSLSEKFIVICLIIYSTFQFYQTFSSIKLVFFESRGHYSTQPHIHALVIYHAIGYCSSSVCLIFGSLKKKFKLLMFAQVFLIYKLAFMSWQFYDSFDETIGCDSRKYECDPNRLMSFYKHCAFFSELKKTKCGSKFLI